MTGSEDLQRRVIAAQVLGGFERVEDLAATIDRRGLGRDTLYDIRAGKRRVQPHELRWIGEACGLPVEFFEVDFSELPDLIRAAQETAASESVDERLASLEEDVTALLAYVRRISPARSGGGEAPSQPGQAPESPVREDPQTAPAPATSRRRVARRHGAA